MGDVENGKKIFQRACAQCHTITQGGSHKQGPNLYNAIGKPSGQAPGYNYSDSYKKNSVTWNKETLDQYLKDPKKFFPGTKMIFPGLKKDNERQDLIAYLFSVAGK